MKRSWLKGQGVYCIPIIWQEPSKLGVYVLSHLIITAILRGRWCFMKEEIEIDRGEVTCVRSDSWKVQNSILKPRFADSWAVLSFRLDSLGFPDRKSILCCNHSYIYSRVWFVLNCGLCKQMMVISQMYCGLTYLYCKKDVIDLDLKIYSICMQNNLFLSFSECNGPFEKFLIFYVCRWTW